MKILFFLLCPITTTPFQHDLAAETLYTASNIIWQYMALREDVSVYRSEEVNMQFIYSNVLRSVFEFMD